MNWIREACAIVWAEMVARPAWESGCPCNRERDLVAAREETQRRLVAAREDVLRFARFGPESVARARASVAYFERKLATIPSA